MFSFFLEVYRKNICTFCGSIVNVEFNIDSVDSKICFKQINNGEFTQGKIPITKHPNILRGVIIGKKSWGLWVNEWSDGICEWSFTLEEILEEFKNKDIKIPDQLLLDFENRINKKKHLRNLKYFQERMQV